MHLTLVPRAETSASSICESERVSELLTRHRRWGWGCLALFALIGLLLEFRLEPRLVFGLTAANPIEAARLAILSGIDPELSVFGPVGFWLANTLGPKLTGIIGVGWPALLGSGAMLLAERRLQRTDLVG